MGLSPAQSIRYACEQLERAAAACRAAAGRTLNPGLRKLLVSLHEQEKENAGRLAQWQEEPEALIPEDAPALDQDALAAELPPAPDDKGLLLSLIEQKKKLGDMFQALAARAPTEDGRVFFRSLSVDEVKQRTLMQDRYDLLALS